MKRGDFLWGAVLVVIVGFLMIPKTHEIFISASKSSPYVMGFIKFMVLASMGELLAIRLAAGRWGKPKGLLWRVLVWGLIGMAVTLMFALFDGGVRVCLENGLLPAFSGSGLVSALGTAFSISLLTNVFFGTSFMLFHRLTDTWIDLGGGKLTQMKGVSLSHMLEAADLKGFVSFVIFKTIPAFWVPAHTVTFLLPPEYRVLMAAMLSICLGLILGIARRGTNGSGSKAVKTQ